MIKEDKLYKIINLSWIIIAFIPIFGGLGLIYAGYRVHENRWIDEGIIYLIPFILLSLTIFNDIVAILILISWIITVVRALMIARPFLSKLEENENEDTTVNKVVEESFSRKIDF